MICYMIFFKRLLLPFMLLAFCTRCVAQELSTEQLSYLQDNGIALIDSNSLYHAVLKDNYKVKLVVIFTNYCVGTPYVFSNIATYKAAFGDTAMDYILCSGAPRNELKDLVKLLQTNHYTGKVFLIDPKRHREYKDDRIKGFLFRNSICRPCQDDELGTPYYIFYDRNNAVLFAGYPSRYDFKKLLQAYFEQHR